MKIRPCCVCRNPTTRYFIVCDDLDGSMIERVYMCFRKTCYAKIQAASKRKYKEE